LCYFAKQIGDDIIRNEYPVPEDVDPAYWIPDEKALELDHLIDLHPSQMMLWEDHPLEEVEKLLNEKGIQVVVFNPCGNKPGDGDFIENMNANVTALQNALSF
jgi:zinc transport system substrate-binding protein